MDTNQQIRLWWQVATIYCRHLAIDKSDVAVVTLAVNKTNAVMDLWKNLPEPKMSFVDYLTLQRKELERLNEYHFLNKYVAEPTSRRPGGRHLP